MSKFRGSKGFVALGGIVTGTALLNGAKAQGQLTANIDGAPLTGVILKGDKFTVAGDAQIYTIGVDVLITANAAAIAFTPAVVPGGGWADNAVITFASNSLAQVRSFDVNISRPPIDTTCMGDSAKKTALDTPQMSGSIVCLFDYGDAEQAEAIDEAKADGDIGEIGIVLGYDTDKQIYGHVAVPQVAIRSQRGQMVEAALSVEGHGSVAVDWD
jgi:hypothetical protein